MQTLRNESSDLVRERDRLKEDISTLETSCSDKSGEVERLNSQLETISAELKVKKVVVYVPLDARGNAVHAPAIIVIRRSCTSNLKRPGAHN